MVLRVWCHHRPTSTVREGDDTDGYYSLLPWLLVDRKHLVGMWIRPIQVPIWLGITLLAWKWSCWMPSGSLPSASVLTSMYVDSSMFSTILPCILPPNFRKQHIYAVIIMLIVFEIMLIRLQQHKYSSVLSLSRSISRNINVYHRSINYTHQKTKRRHFRIMKD